MLADAALVAVASAAQQLLGNLESAAAKLTKHNKRNENEVSLPQSILHAHSAVGFVLEKVQRYRVEIGLTREEIKAWERDLKRFARGDVRFSSSANAQIKSIESPPVPSDFATSAFRNVTSLAKNTTKTVIGAAAKGKGQHRQSQQLFNKYKANALAVATESLQFQPPKEFLEAEGQQLALSKQSTGTTAAREIEASVNSLSTLTAIMNDHVTQQSEQITFIQRQTDDSKDSLRRGTDELRKPQGNHSSWILALILWISSAVLLLFHRILR